MELDAKEVQREIKNGDILILGLGRIPYLVIENRVSESRYDLVSLSGNTYWTGDLNYDQLQNLQKDAYSHYSYKEYKLQLVKA